MQRQPRALVPHFVALCVALALGACATTESAEQGKPSSGAPSAPTTNDVRAEAKLVAVDGATAEDPEMVALLEPYAKEVRERANRVVGVLAAPMPKGPRDAPESTLGNFVTDAMRTQMAKAAGVAVDVCFTNRGGLRTDLPAGEITEGQVVELMPFDNAVVVFPVSGERLLRLIDRLAERGDWASGMSYIRKDRKHHELKVSGQAVDPGKTYWVCTNDYVYEGGGGYGLDDVESPTYTGVLVRDVILAAFEEAHARGEKIEPRLDGRVRSE